MKRSAVIVLAAIVSLAIPFVVAAAPLGQTIGYSGYARYLGVPAQGPYNVVFKIYDDPTSTAGANLKWEEDWTTAASHPQITFTDGEFSVNLGTYTSLVPALDFHSNVQYWLEVAIEGTVLSPRKALLFVPYSFSSQVDTRAADPGSPVTGQMWLIVP